MLSENIQGLWSEGLKIIKNFEHPAGVRVFLVRWEYQAIVP
jgi:hypothetical protein